MTTLEPPPAAVPVTSAGATDDREVDADASTRLAEGVRRLRIGNIHLGERILMVAGFVAVGFGLLFIALGWYGAAHTPNLYEQIPYVASGGLFGLGLLFLGGFFYFAHWLTELVKEHRTQSTALLEAITRLDDTVRQQAAADRGSAPAGSNGAATAHDRELVATAHGTMAHRRDCVVTAGKKSLRNVAADEGLDACKLCDPYGDD